MDADELAERDALGANDRMQQRMAGTDMDVVDYARSHEAIVEFKEEQRERRRRDKMNYGDWLKSDDGKKAVTSLIPFPDFVAERADIPGLIEHVNVWANHHGQQLGFPDPEAKKKEAQGGFDEEEKMEFGLTNLLRRDDDTRIPIDDMDLRYVTYATHEYWPMVKTLIHSMERNAPRPLLFLTVMLTDEDDLAECQKLSKANRVAPFSCFLDFDALNILRREETESNQDRYNRDSDELLRGMYEQMAEGWGAAGSSSSSAGLGNMGGGDDDATGSDLATLGSDGRITRHAADMLRAMNRTQLVDAIVDLQHAHEARTSARHDGSAEVVEQPEEKPYVRDWVDDVTELGFIAIPAELADQFETRQKPVEPVEVARRGCPRGCANRPSEEVLEETRRRRGAQEEGSRAQQEERPRFRRAPRAQAREAGAGCSSHSGCRQDVHRHRGRCHPARVPQGATRQQARRAFRDTRRRGCSSWRTTRTRSPRSASSSDPAAMPPPTSVRVEKARA